MPGSWSYLRNTSDALMGRMFAHVYRRANTQIRISYRFANYPMPSLKSCVVDSDTIHMTEHYNAVDQILDEDYIDNIFLYDDEADKDVEFEQVALIPIDEEVYVILKPVTPVEGVGENEAIAFRIDFAPTEEDEDILVVIEDDDLVTKIFDEYYELLKEEEDAE